MTESLLKWFDTLLVRPLLCFWMHLQGELRSAEVTARLSEVKKILLIRPGGAGDAVLLLPLLKALHKQGKEVAVCYMSRNLGVFSLFKEQGLVHHLFSLECVAGFKEAKAFAPEVILDTEQGFLLSSVYGALLGAKVRVGFDVGPKRVLLTHFVQYSQERFEAEMFLELLGPLGYAERFDTPDLLLPKMPSTLQIQPPAVAFYGGGSKKGKRISQENSLRILQELSKHFAQIVFIGGADCIEVHRELSKGLPSVMDKTGVTSVSETVGILQQCEAFVGTDSLPLHLSVLAGVSRIVALFGPSVDKKWACPGRVSVIAHEGITCRPCNYGRFAQTPPCPIGYKCLAEIDVKRVVSTAIGS